MTNATTEGTAKWSDHGTEVSYVLFSGDQALSTTALTSSTTPAISNAILLPQSFNHTPNKVSIKVDYSILHGSSYLPLTQTFVLSATSVSSVAQSDWELG